MNGLLFRIETDRVALNWSRSRGEDPPILQSKGPAPGRLAIHKRRRDLVFKNIERATAPDAIASDPEQILGPRLYEQTDYKIYARAKSGRRVSILHRDPVIIRDLSEEDDGWIAHGYVNFGSQIGRSLFSVLVDGRPEFDFEVEVFPTKLDYKSDYESLLAEIQEILTGLALEYLRSTFQLGLSARIPHPTRLEWLALLRNIASDLEKAVRRIAKHPVRRLAREPSVIRAEKIKRIDSSMRSSIMRGAGSGAFIKLDRELSIRRMLIEKSARPTLDTPEHRWLAAQLDRIRRAVGRLRREEALRETSERRTRVLREMDELEARIARLCLLEPFAAAQGEPPAGFASLQLLGAPGYKEAYKACLTLSLGLRIEGGPLRLSVKDLSLLYEYWCRIALLRIVSEETGRPIPVKDLFAIKQRGLQVLLQKGRESEVSFDAATGRKVTIAYNPRFDGDQMLVPQQPDMVITFDDPQWPKLRFLLDAKYRIDASPEYAERYGSPGPPEDAINALHRYRDAVIENIKNEDDDNSGQDDRPKRTIVQAAAIFPFREASEGAFRECALWRSLERLGIGAVPALPGDVEYLREWLRSALQRGGWAIADRVIDHQARRRAQDWRASAADAVLIGVLRAEDPSGHLEWILKKRLYYAPLLKSQQRQLSTKRVAVYSPASLRSPGAVTHAAKVESVEIVKRSEIDTPWPPLRRRDEQQVLYRLGEATELTKPIENRNESGRGQRFSVNRWTSRLALERAAVLTELFLETEPEWRFYEDLRAGGITFRLEAGQASVKDPDDLAGRAWFVMEDSLRIRYAGASGFIAKRPNGEEKYFLHHEDLLRDLRDLRG